jgi:hypothetical protein
VSKSPESSVEVVDARITSLPCVQAVMSSSKNRTERDPRLRGPAPS